MRVTPSSNQQSEDWVEERWYLLELDHVDRIEPKGSPGYQGKPRRWARVSLVWKLPETDEWLWDNFDLTVNVNKDGTPSICKQLMCALTGRNHLTESTPWVDDETLEFGFDEQVAGVLASGVRVAARGKWGLDGKQQKRFSIEKYAAPASVSVATTPPTPPASQPTISPDGRWRWDGSGWVANTASTPPPTAPPTQERLI